MFKRLLLIIFLIVTPFLMMSENFQNGSNLFYGNELGDLANVAATKAGGIINQSSKAILKDGFYEVNGFKYSQYYFEKLWNTGRGGSSLVAREVLGNATNVIPDAVKAGFNKYIYGGWEMVYNPATKEIWHIMPIKP